MILGIFTTMPPHQVFEILPKRKAGTGGVAGPAVELICMTLLRTTEHTANATHERTNATSIPSHVLHFFSNHVTPGIHLFMPLQILFAPLQRIHQP